MQLPSDNPPHKCITDAAGALRIDLTSELDQQEIQRVRQQAMIFHIGEQFRTVELSADAAKRDELKAWLGQPDEIGGYIRNLRIFGCDEWLIDSPDAHETVNDVAQQAKYLKLLHIKQDNRYLDWALMPRMLQALLHDTMQKVNVVMMEGVKNVPASLIPSLKDVYSLDLARVRLAPISADAASSRPTTTSGPRELAVHTGFARVWNEQESGATLDTIRRLNPTVQLDSLTTLYLDQLGCSGCTGTWKEIIQLCEATLLNLRLNYKWEGNGFEIKEDELINLSGLRSLQSLVLVVVAHPLSITALSRIIDTLSIPAEPPAQPLDLGVCVDDRQVPSGRNWTDELILGGQVTHAGDWAVMDKKFFQILSKRMNAKISFRLPRAKTATQGVAEAYIKKTLPNASQTDDRFKFESVEEEFSLHKIFSLSGEEM